MATPPTPFEQAGNTLGLVHIVQYELCGQHFQILGINDVLPGPHIPDRSVLLHVRFKCCPLETKCFNIPKDAITGWESANKEKFQCNWFTLTPLTPGGEASYSLTDQGH